MEQLQLPGEIKFKEIAEEINSGFLSKNEFLESQKDSKCFFSSFMENSDAALFVMNLKLRRIIWGDQNFYSINSIKKEYLVKPAFEALIFRNMHPKDRDMLQNEEMASILKKNKVSVSKFFRIKQKNKTWKYFHLLLIPSKTNFSEDSIRIGIQFDLTNLFSKELKDKSSFSGLKMLI